MKYDQSSLQVLEDLDFIETNLLELGIWHTFFALWGELL